MEPLCGRHQFECQVWSLPTPTTMHDSADQNQQRCTHGHTNKQWQKMVAPLHYFSGDDVRATDQSVNTAGPWAVEHVTLRGGARAVRGAFQGRPGLELLSLCASFYGQDRSATFAQIEASIDSLVTATPATQAPAATP